MTSPQLSDPPAAQIARMASLYAQGRFVSAYRLICAFKPFEGWTDTALPAVVRLLPHVGAPQRARSLASIAFRRRPDDDEVLLCHAQTQVAKMDSRSSVLWLTRLAGQRHFSSPKFAALWQCLQARAHAELREFELANSLLERAARALHHEPDHSLATARSLELQGREPEAIEALAAAAEARPLEHSITCARARLLGSCGREREARHLLRHAAAHFESAEVWSLLAGAEARSGNTVRAVAAREHAMTLLPGQELEVGPAASVPSE
jgi:predicted Zn-dependent protease